MFTALMLPLADAATPHASFLMDWANRFWMICIHGLPYLLFGLVLAGLMQALLRQETVARHLGKRSFGSSLRATLFGAPLPLCSCGVVPAALSLRRSGASKPATQSFLITVPETGVDSVAITYAFFGPVMAFARPVAAIATGLTAGAMELIFGRRETEAAPSASAPAAGGVGVPLTIAMSPGTANATSDSEQGGCCCGSKATASAKPDPEAEKAAAGSPCCASTLASETQPLWQRLLAGQRYAFGPMLRDIALFMLIGLALAAAVEALLPPNYFGTGGAAVIALPAIAWYAIMVLGGVPIYVCAASMTPMAAALAASGVPIGAVLVFLLAGPATNLATLGIVRNELGNRSLVIYLLSIGVVAISAGVLLDLLVNVLPIPVMAGSMAVEHHHSLLIEGITVLMLTLLIVAAAMPTIGRLRRWLGSENDAHAGHAHA